MPRTPKHRNGRAAAAGVAAGVLALAMATGINLGILGAAGSPQGPGALEGAQVVAVGRPDTHDAGRSPGRLLHERRGERDQGPESAEPTGTASVATTTSPRATAAAPQNGVAPSPTWRPAPLWSHAAPPTVPATGGRSTPRTGGSDSGNGGSESEQQPHHRFGAKNDD